MSDPLPLSAYIVCQDERDFLGECLDSLEGFGDIVIVDSGSTDGTLDLIRDYQARGFPVRLFEREWPGYSAQKQFALDQCAGPWCLNLDADERLTPELREWLRSFTPAPDEAAIAFQLVDFLPGYGYPPRAVHAQFHRRFARKDKAHYKSNQRVHEGLEIDGKVRNVPGLRIRHYRLMSISEAMRKALHYSELKAQDMLDRGRRSTFATITTRPLFTFIKYYFLHRYLLCGIPGLIYSVEAAIYVYLSDAKLYRKSLGAGAPSE